MILQDDEDSSLSFGKYIIGNAFIGLLVAISIVVICVQFSLISFLPYAVEPVSASVGMSQNVSACLIDWYFPERDKNSEIRMSRESINKCSDEVVQTEQEKDFSLELTGLLSGYPMADMIPEMVKQDRVITAFLVGIAKKESDWGKHVPSLNGNDCYNYWGYKGAAGRGSSMGYACFSSPEEAVMTVGGKIGNFVYEKKRDTPAEMVIWKCGSSCAGHDPGSVASWIGSVNTYYQKIIRKEEARS